MQHCPRAGAKAAKGADEGMMDEVVIVGAGHAGLQAALSLRDEGFGGRIRLIGEEAVLPYQRPPLSKAFLTGEAGEANLVLRPQALLDEARITVTGGTRVDGIDRARARIAAGKDSIAYDHLILATGSRNRHLEVPGATASGVLSLRGIDDARRLREHLGAARRVVVVGAGFIGLEFAAVAAKRGCEVEVLELGDRAMARAVSEAVSTHCAARHEGWGVRFRFEAGVIDIEQAGGKARGVRLADGELIPADLVLVGVGAIANAELAAEAGLATGNGITVDAHLRTADHAISAIGDCAFHPNAFAEGPVRLESVQNAIDQARAVAARLAGQPKPYQAVPWFWSDQGDMKIQMAGLTARRDQVIVRGDPAGGRFSVFCFRNQLLLGVESVNRPADHMLARRLLATGRRWTLAEAEAFDFDLKAMTAEAPRGADS
jgi:3-phenylpropionate/trans-cinnamate dioxygenase ferredoxin reductase subunit